MRVRVQGEGVGEGEGKGSGWGFRVKVWVSHLINDCIPNIPFISLEQSSHCWSPWQCGSHRPLSHHKNAWGLGAKARQEQSWGQEGASGVSQPRADCSFLGRKSRSQASLGKARPRQSSLAQGTLPDQGSQRSWSSAILEAHSAPPQQGLQQQATGLPPLPRRRLPSTCPVHSASRRSHTSPPAGLGSGVTSPELGLWAGTQTRRGRPQQPAHSSAGEKSIREPMSFRQMMGDQKWVARLLAADTTQGALGAWCSQCGAESGQPSNSWRSSAVALPFPSTELSVLEPLEVWNSAIPKPSQTYVSAGEESAREPTCVRQLLGARRVSIWVCGAADTSQGPWETGTLRAALSLGGQATAGGALQLPFHSLWQSSHCWSPWQWATNQPQSPPQGLLEPKYKGKAGAEVKTERRAWHLPGSSCLLRPGEGA